MTMSTDLYSFEDLVLVQTLVELENALEEFTREAPRATVEEKYLHVCALQRHTPSPAYMAFLRACRDTEEPVEAVGEQPLPNDGQAATPCNHPTEGCLSFEREYMGATLLLPILATLPECGSHLRSLSLSRCNLSSASVQLLCGKCLVHCAGLQVIDISGNPCCGSLAVEALLQLVKKQRSICECNIRGVHSIGPLNRRLVDALGRNRVSA